MNELTIVISKEDMMLYSNTDLLVAHTIETARREADKRDMVIKKVEEYYDHVEDSIKLRFTFEPKNISERDKNASEQPEKPTTN